MDKLKLIVKFWAEGLILKIFILNFDQGVVYPKLYSILMQKLNYK